MSDYLIHYGVKGMKWGVRKQRPYSGSKRAYRQANREYSKSFNKAANYSSTHLIRQDIKGSKWQKESDRRWRDVFDKADAVNKAKAKYKQEKKAYKEANPGMSTKKKVAIAATVVGVASVGTALAIYGKKTYGSLNPKKIAAGRELANRISGRSNDVALKSIKNYSIHTGKLDGGHYAIKTSTHGFGRNKYYIAKSSYEPGSLYKEAYVRNRARVMGSEPHITVKPYDRKAKINSAYAGIVGVNTKKPRIRR